MGLPGGAQRRRRPRLPRRPPATVSIEDADPGRAGASPSHEAEVSDRLLLERVRDLLRELGALDRQVMLLYLEDESAATIAEVSGLTPGAVATRVHRLKRFLAERFSAGADT